MREEKKSEKKVEIMSLWKVLLMVIALICALHTTSGKRVNKFFFYYCKFIINVYYLSYKINLEYLKLMSKI